MPHTGASRRPQSDKRTLEYYSWANAKSRCHNPKDKSYPDYGGRGISMDPLWRRSFNAFIKYIGPRPSADFSLDRIDPNGGYVPGNVRWATRLEQNNNKRLSDGRVREILDRARTLQFDSISAVIDHIATELLGA